MHCNQLSELYVFWIGRKLLSIIPFNIEFVGKWIIYNFYFVNRTVGSLSYSIYCSNTNTRTTHTHATHTYTTHAQHTTNTQQQTYTHYTYTHNNNKHTTTNIQHTHITHIVICYSFLSHCSHYNWPSSCWLFVMSSWLS